MSDVGLVIGLPCSGRNTVIEWGISLGMAMQNYPTNTTVALSVVKGKPRDFARNEIAQHAKKLGAEFLWFVDDDVAVPFFALRYLLYQLRQADPDVMAIGGIYTSKRNPPEPLVYQGDGIGAFWNWKVGDVFECKRIATGCLLIKTEVFDKIEEPWFKDVDNDTNGRMVGDTHLVREAMTDDMWFCRKVTEAGYRILAHGGVQCIHWDLDKQIPYMLPPDSYPMKPRIEKPTLDQVLTVAGGK